MQETQETWVRSLVQENPLEEGMATHSSILAWEITWAQEPGRLESMGSQKSPTTERLSTKTEQVYISKKLFYEIWE